MKTAVPSRHEGGATVTLDEKENAYYEVLEEIAEGVHDMQELLGQVRDLLTTISEQQKRTNNLLDRE